jgi:DNA-binding transcriptional LysR family regulator
MKTTVWTLHNGLERMEIPIAGRFQLNSGGMIRRLATLGMGIALLPEAIVADDIAGGRLRRIMPRWEGSPVTVYAVTETRLLPARTQRFIEFLRDRLGRA